MKTTQPPELEQALIETFVRFENLGYLVYSRAIPLHMADDLIGGMVRLTWRKCRGYIGQFRAVTPTAFEWFEWLYDRMGAVPGCVGSGRRGSHLAKGLEAVAGPAARVSSITRGGALSPRVDELRGTSCR
jgi:hypothetical protein